MGGSSSSSSSSHSIPYFYVTAKTKDGNEFHISNHSLIDHIVLLRQVILRPELTEDGPMLDNYIKEYCARMAGQKMSTEREQLELPLEIEWIWHVHRLHPLVYRKDCAEQLPGGKNVDKIAYQLKNYHRIKLKSKSRRTLEDNHLTFVPSIDLKKAAIRQRAFLEKFLKHRLYEEDLTYLHRSYFDNLVQNYMSFLSLATKDQLIVPTFDIDLIWHTYMRFPSEYQDTSKTCCGFILDHDDAIESKVLEDAYKKTAERWKENYGSNYGDSVLVTHRKAPQYKTSNATVVATHQKAPRHETLDATFDTAPLIFSPVSSCEVTASTSGGEASCDVGGGTTCTDSGATSCGGGGGAASTGGGGSSCGGGGASSCGGGGGSSCGGGGGSSCGGGCGGGGD